MPPILILDSLMLDPQAILSFEAPPGLSENTRSALEFCRMWLRGESHFTLTTSGSTGDPKPIRLSRRQMEASARATAQVLAVEPGMRCLVCLPTRFVAGRMMLVRGLVLGLEMTVVEPAANPLLATPPEAQFDLAAFVPLQLAEILRGPQATFSQIDRARAILVGGAPVDAALLRAVSALHAPVYHTYGMTESATHVALRRLNGARPETAFRALPGVELAVDERGCLLLRGPMTDSAWIQTNDLVEIVATNRFEWLGRADNVINSGGVKVLVEPLEAEIEAHLAYVQDQLPNWHKPRYFVAGVDDERLGRSVTLYLEGEAIPEEVRQAFLKRLRSAFGPYRAPRDVRFVTRFCETPTGKIDRERSQALAPGRAA